MEIREIAANLIGCKPENLLAFKNYGESGVAAIGPDGKKYIYTVAELKEKEIEIKHEEQARKKEAELEEAEAERKAAEAEAKPKPKRSTPAKRKRTPAKRSRSTRSSKTTAKGGSKQ